MAPIRPFDENWLAAAINAQAIKAAAALVPAKIAALSAKDKVNRLLIAVKCIDLTTLAGDDTIVNVQRLCCRAQNAFRQNLLNQLAELKYDVSTAEHIVSLTTAAVCVYPARVADCVDTFARMNRSQLIQPATIGIAAVATGFPSGQYSLATRLSEIDFATTRGATEIDVVINRPLALAGAWRELYDEVCQMSKLCAERNAHLKVILAVGELGSLENVYKASMVSMMAGADFIKTSTGKEAVNATLTTGTVMLRAIYDFYTRTKHKIGFKPAGGLKSARDALCWLYLVEHELSADWINANLFRIGASSLLNEIEREVFTTVFKRAPRAVELSI